MVKILQFLKGRKNLLSCNLIWRIRNLFFVFFFKEKENVAHEILEIPFVNLGNTKSMLINMEKKNHFSGHLTNLFNFKI